MIAFAWVAGIVAALVIIGAGVGSLAMAAGVLPDGSRLRKVGSLLIGIADAAAVVIAAAFFIIAGGGRNAGAIRKQTAAQARVRAAARDARASVAAEMRATQAHAEGVVVDIRIDAGNRIASIRRDVAAMDDAALTAAYEAARGRDT